jgi:hypothetical protein
MPRALIRFLVPFLILSLAPSLAAGIAWRTSLDEALAAAKSQNAPVFVAVNMDGERANDEMVAERYVDPRIVELAARCAALFASADDHSGSGPCRRCGGPVTCEQHKSIEKTIRAKYLQRAADGGYVAPEHLFLDPEGKVLLSVPYRVSRGELEWCLVTAIRAVDPGFVWSLAADAKPPRRLVTGGVAAEGLETTEKAPTKKEVDEILAELNKTKKWFEKIDLMFRLLRSDDPRALSFFETILSGKMPNREDGLLGFLRAMGRSSPREYGRLVAPFLEDDRAAVKAQAIVTLELLADPKTLPALLKRYKAEKDVQFKKDLVRAIASCGAKDKAAQKLVLAAAGAGDDPILRANAMLGCEHLADAKAVAAAIDAAFAESAPPELRFAAGYVTAALRLDSKRAALEAAGTAETDPAVKAALAACLAVFDGGSLSSLDGYLRSLCRSDLPRDRL